MPSPHERLAQLLERYSTRKTTPEEEEELYALVHESGDQQLINDHIRQLLKQFDRRELMPAADWESIYSQVREKAFPGTVEEAVMVKRRKWSWFNWAAAVCILLLLGGGAWFISKPVATTVQNSVAVNKHVAPVQTDAAPGKTGAILTLAGGKQILLDSAGNGILGKQGNASLQNHNGQLFYNNETIATTTETLYNTMTTTRGMQYKLVLADGSKVWLNAASSITFPTCFTGKQRKVNITGEVYFEIAHDASRPFSVSANGVDIQVLGTHFNVNAYEDEDVSKTTLFEGSVKLLNGHGHAGTYLIPGQQAQISKAGKINVTSDADLEEVIAWKDGLFIMKKAGIASIMRQVARWYDVDVVYENGIPSGRISGDIPRNMNLSKVLEVMELSGVHFSIDGKMVKVKP